MALRIPSPKALTKPEAYLAYKAGIMSRDELKQSVYNPLNNYEGWLAKWCELLETYPTNKDGTPQCLTDEEGLLAYLCGVTDRYPATNSRPDDARISAYIRYLVSARYARPDHPLNREEFYLSLIKTQFIPSGDPSSDIVIDGTTKAPFVDVKAYGDTLQNSYSGKNLWNGEFGQGQTYNPTTTNRITTTQSPALRSGQTYTVSAFNLPSGFRYAVALFANPAYPGSNPGTAVFDSGWKTSESFSFTPSSDCYFAVVMSRTDNASLTPSDVSSASYQLELGSTATDYEPYVGGIPAPNPEFPQPISVVTGENVVKVVGKNLQSTTWGQDFVNAVHDTSRGWLATEDGKSCVAFVPNAGYNSYPTKNFTLGMTFQPNTQYTASFDEKSTASNRHVAFYYTDGTYSSYTATPANTWTRVTMTSLDGKTVAYIAPFYTAGTTYIDIDTFQIELGTTATAYEPYQGQEFPIDLGSIELAKIGTYQDRIYKDGEKWYVEKNVGKVVLDGSQNWVGATSTGSPSFLYAYNSTLDSLSKWDEPQGLSDRFTIENTPLAIGSVKTAPCMSLSTASAAQAYHVRVFVPLTLASTPADFKSWLSTHPTTVYYALATPTVTEITNQTLIDQLNALKQGGAEDGTTYIIVSATEPNLPAKLYVEAPKYD